MLVLLTIVLTTSTFIAAGGIPVELPKASSKRQGMLKTKTIQIDSDGSVYLDTGRIELYELGASISALDRDIPILIRADRDIALQTFVDVLYVVKTLSFRKASLQTEDRA